MKIDKTIYRYIEFELFNYENYKKTINDIRTKILESSPNPPDGMPRGNGYSNPTESKAIKLVSSVALYKMETTINAIDQALKMLTQRHEKIFEMVYEKGRKDVYLMSDELGISYDTFSISKRQLILAVGHEMGII